MRGLLWLGLLAFLSACGAQSDADDNEESGTGGATGHGGTGGVTGIPMCVPGQQIACACVDGQSGAQVCTADGRYDDCSCGSIEDPLTTLRAQMVGSWSGERTTQWDGTFAVDVEFRADGTFAAHCGGDCSAFYWGGDGDAPGNRYSLNSANGDPTGFGELSYEGLRGDLQYVRLSADQSMLNFEHWRQQYGPVTFALTRN